MKGGPLVLRDGNPCGCLCVSFGLTHLVLQFLCRTIHFEKSTLGPRPTYFRKEVRWLEILAADILKESVPRSVLDNSVWAIIARFRSLQTRAQAEVATARGRAASQVIVLQ